MSCYQYSTLLFHCQEHEVKFQLQSVRLTVGGTLMKEGKLFDAMEMFEQVKTPPGMFNLAQVLFCSCTECSSRLLRPFSFS